MRRTVIAFIAAPLVPALLFVYSAGPFLALTLSYFWAYLLGLPAFFLLRRFARERHDLYALIGFSIGFLFIFVQAPLTGSQFLGALAIGATGAITALAFSLIRGPERKYA